MHIKSFQRAVHFLCGANSLFTSSSLKYKISCQRSQRLSLMFHFLQINVWHHLLKKVVEIEGVPFGRYVHDAMLYINVNVRVDLGVNEM